VKAVAPYDPPPGDGQEDNSNIPNATDGNPNTAWETEQYASPLFGNLKSGVGLVLAAPHPVKLSSLTITSDTPRFNARIKAGSSPSGPFQRVSSSQTVEHRTTFKLDVPSPERYYLIWITELVPQSNGFSWADANEVTARG